LNYQAVKGDGCRRKIKHILEYLLEMKDFQDMFEGQEEPTIRLQFAGDGRQTSKKIGTFTSLITSTLHACIMASFYIFLSGLK